MAERLRVALLFGGRSAEHEVSRVTAAHVLGAIDPARYDVRPIAITRTGAWVEAEAAAKALAAGRDALPDALDAVLRAPVVTADTLAKTLQVTPRAAPGLLQQLMAAGVVREVTGRASWRAFMLG